MAQVTWKSARLQWYVEFNQCVQMPNDQTFWNLTKIFAEGMREESNKILVVEPSPWTES